MPAIGDDDQGARIAQLELDNMRLRNELRRVGKLFRDEHRRVLNHALLHPLRIEKNERLNSAITEFLMDWDEGREDIKHHVDTVRAILELD